MNNESKSAIDHKKYEAVKRLYALADNIEHGIVIVDEITYLQTHDLRDGLLVITKPKEHL